MQKIECLIIVLGLEKLLNKYTVFIKYCCILMVSIGIIGCSQPSDQVYVDEKYGYSFSYPQYWSPVKLAPDLLRLIRAETGSVEAEIRFLVLETEATDQLDVLSFLADLLETPRAGGGYSPDAVTVIQEPYEVQHNNYEGARAGVQIDTTFDFPIGIDGLIVPVRDSIEILAIEDDDIIVVIYVFSSPEEFSQEEATILESFSFTVP